MKNRSFAIYITIGLLLLITAVWTLRTPPSKPFDAAQDKPQVDSVITASAVPATEPPPFPSETPTAEAVLTPFDGQRAHADVETQVAFGARSPGTDGHAKIREWMRAELEAAGWQVEAQESETLGHPVVNLIAKRGDEPPQIIAGAHYDSRMFADHDPDPAKQMEPVPAANDGASGVAVLLGLARSLPADTTPIWLVFFDAEDNGRIEGWEWILGSREFVKNNPAVRPDAVVIVDMIGDADLNIFKERNSNAVLTEEIWTVAKELGYENKFIPEYKHSILDDHMPFLEAGIPAVDIIDFDYPYYHTLADTPDKVSAESLQAVGDTLYTWIIRQHGQ